MIAVGKTPYTDWVVAQKLITQGRGLVTVSNRDGTVMSVQPDGRVGARPAGFAGPYERATVIGNNLVFHPVEGKVYVFPYLSELP